MPNFLSITCLLPALLSLYFPLVTLGGTLPEPLVTASRSDSGKGPEMVRDGDAETNWAAPGPGDRIDFRFFPGEGVEGVAISQVQIHFTRSTTRSYTFSILTYSGEGTVWETRLANQTSALVEGPQVFLIDPVPATALRIVIHFNSENNYANLLEVDFTGTLQPLPAKPETYERWLDRQFPPPREPQAEAYFWGPLADPDRDSRINVYEFLEGTEPLVADVSPLTLQGEEGFAEMRAQLHVAPAPFVLRTEFTIDLVQWQPVFPVDRSALENLSYALNHFTFPPENSQIFIRMTADTSRLQKIRQHFDKLLVKGNDIYGSKTTVAWMSSLDTETGNYPEDDERSAEYPSRVYRYIAAPKGSNPYWDLPQMIAAKEVTHLTGMKFYEDKVDAYLTFIFENLVDEATGLLLWGNHYYYDAFDDVVRFFGANEYPKPLGQDPAGLDGKFHEARPIPVPWEMLWAHDPQKTERFIRAMLDRHIVNQTTGEFNRHATPGGTRHAFLESGAVLVHAAAFLYEKTGEAAILDQANLLIAYSLSGENPVTHLVANCPNSPVGRWDRVISTTEIGLWTRALLVSRPYLSESAAQTWLEHCDRILTAWLGYAWNEELQQYYGNLNIADGTPVLTRETIYQPGEFSDVWEPLFPTHDYPMALAESCLELYRVTSQPRYQEACERWANIIRTSLPARSGKGGYAEHYGRCLHFLLGCDEVWPEGGFKELAQQVAEEATRFLWAGTMFRSHPQENRYDAVDGMGYLLLALQWFETGEQPQTSGFFF